MSYHTYSASGSGGGASQPEVDALITLSGRPSLSTDLGTFTGTTIPDGSTIKDALQDLESAIEAVPDSLVYAGTWAASTNTPTLADGVGTTGEYYFVSDAGTVDFGAGNITFAAGDRVVYEGSVWQKWDTSVGVKSVNGDTGPDVVIGVAELDDVDLAGLADGDALLWNAGNSEWVPGPAGSVSSVNGQTGAVDLALDDLSDVNAPTPGDGDALIWDNTNGEWIPGPSGAVDSVNGQTGVVVLDAGDIGNTPAGTISATDVQAAINELDGGVVQVATDLSDHESATNGAHAASAISNVPAGTIAATNVQDAIDELDGDVQAVDTLIDNHIADTSGAHAASAISNTPAGTISATDVQAAIDELDGDVQAAGTAASDAQTDIDDHIAETTGAHASSAISYPDSSGYYSATEVEGALDKAADDLSVLVPYCATFTGTSVTPSGGYFQKHTYTGGSSQTFTGFGSLAGVLDGTEITLVGTSDTNVLSVAENDATDGWLMNGPILLTRGRLITFIYSSTLGRVVEKTRN